MKYAHNPYDFGNPVIDKELFVGRYDEMKEVKYYLHQTKFSPQPINLAMLGKRASGKTSVLNMAELEAKSLDFCTVRINLDEGDAESELNFFYKIFASLLLEVCNMGTFNGKDGKTFQTYIEMISTYEVPKDKTFCPFIFPIIYAKAMDSNRVNAKVPDNIFIEDLIKMQGAVKRPIVLIFDECNVLTQSRILLEKMRNIFMNIKGYMLIIAGTPELFPLMDDVFSPIIRQFKKISVREFQSIEDTRECIRKPLDKNNIDANEVFDFGDETNLQEIHDLSNGSPYEINLICHFLFRRVQENKAELMKLDLRVLEDVRKQLEIEKNIIRRPLLAKIVNLNIQQFKALHFLCRCDGEATFEQLWAVEYIMHSFENWSEGNLKKHLLYFIDEEIINNDSGIINFTGDNFDKIYLKYFAKEKDINLRINNMPLDILWYFGFFKFFYKTPIVVGSTIQGVSGEHCSIDETIKEMSDGKSKIDVFAESFSWAEDLYDVMMINFDKKNVDIVCLEISSSWISIQILLYSRNSGEGQLIELLNQLEKWQSRGKEKNVKLIYQKRNIPNISHEILSKKIVSCQNKMFRRNATMFHSKTALSCYFNEKNIDKAIFHQEICLNYAPDNAEYINNLGYMYISRKSTQDITLAETLLKKVLDIHKIPDDKALSQYNLSIVFLLKGELEEALRWANMARNSCNKEEKVNCVCLFKPKLIDKKIEIEEVEDVKLLPMIDETLKLIEQAQSSK